MATRKYPIGIQTFKRIRTQGYVYVDKTAYVYRMAHQGDIFFFLSRPRRFGKSLLTSTFHSYFAGERELFRGLAIDRLEKEWKQYPVLHFDLGRAKHMSAKQLTEHLHFLLSLQEQEFGITRHPHDVSDRLTNLIITVNKITGQEIVVLVDEYDAPLLDVLHDKTQLTAMRNIMRGFYSPLKACEPMLRFVFLTGITKFSQLSIFSELNNITNISMDVPYAGICGITKEELLEQLGPDIDNLSTALGKNRDETVDLLTHYYDGYHFAWPSPDLFNPFSLLSAFSKTTIEPFWFSSGTPSYLIEMMRHYNFLPSQFTRMEAQVTDFDAPTEQMTSIIPLLYQSGYLTIKGHDSTFDTYTLNLPNHEVELGLMKSFIPYYIMPDTRQVNVTVVDMARALSKGDINGMLHQLQAFLATVPYTRDTNYEGHYQQVLCIIFKLLGGWADVEVHTPRGRVDIVMAFMHRLYVIELKLDSSSQNAMEQINLKGYAQRFATCGLPVTRVAVNFSSTTRNIRDWTIQQ